MSVSLAYSSNLTTITCGECGIEFAMPDRRLRELQDTKGTFYCPNGHSRHFIAETEAQKLKKELEQQKERTRWAEAERDRVSKKLKKVEKRVSKGICPCCNRTFIDLKRHMACKHKKYVADEQK